ncbi:30S ribosomal protein S9, mitochondrial [Prosopis cineraria]|uniref:30S ribosomal protein S9, mitochondrial n=1 Tax=Prosopis cineraria TaxID=364024 RepID=UPI00240FE8EA|nr:30S ribosomal protein S9, mitochondrial [Prosopis cineraria]
MLSRLIPKPSHFRRFVLITSKSITHPQPHFTYSTNTPNFRAFSKYFSTNGNNDNNGKDPTGVWKDFRGIEDKFDAMFAGDNGRFGGFNEGDDGAKAPASKDQWWLEEEGLDNEDEDAIFKRPDKKTDEKGGDFGNQPWHATEHLKPWILREEGKDDVFNYQDFGSNVGEFRPDSSLVESQRIEDPEKLEKEEKQLTAVLKGPDRAFGDLIAVSGITDEMIDSLMALKDFEEVDGLPPLRVIEDMRYEKSIKKSTRAEIERQKQEEAAKARVRKVDEKGRAYGTGRRKCSIARVWVQPGDGKFVVNDKEFDVYFPMLEHRATLLRPFSETKTLGLWDVNCTVKGGGVSGQVGAIQLGISRALQSWEPDLRPALRSAGFLTRDPRVVERKKPGKAKARKSFQWVKR